jgi:GNAT superfamily N-acetyltransferase
MKSPTVRPSRADDVARLCAIDGAASSGDVGRRRLIESAVADAHCLVLSADAEIIAFSITVPEAFFGRDFVELVQVDARYRRAGVGSKLLRHTVEIAKTPRVFTSTNRSNHPMRELLEVGGWHLSGELDGLDEGDTELVYFIDR